MSDETSASANTPAAVDAAGAPTACCPPGALGEAAPNTTNNQPKGIMTEIPVPCDIENSSDNNAMTAIPCYCTPKDIPLAQANRIVVIFTDVYGMNAGRHKVFADAVAHQFCKNNNNNDDEHCCVIIPDLFRGDPILKPWITSTSLTTELVGSALGAPGMVYRIKQYYPPHVIERDVFQIILPWIQKQTQTQTVKLSCIGFCFGGWVVGRVLGYNHNNNNNNSNPIQFQCGVGIHPSFQPNLLHGESPVQVAKRIHKPMLLLPAKNDYDMKPGTEVVNVMKSNTNNTHDEEEEPIVISIEFPTMIHGWVTRGDANDPEVAAEQQRALQLAVDFIQKHSSSSNNNNDKQT